MVKLLILVYSSYAWQISFIPFRYIIFLINVGIMNMKSPCLFYIRKGKHTRNSRIFIHGDENNFITFTILYNSYRNKV